MNVKNLSDLSLRSTEFSVRIVVCDHYLAKPVPGIDVIYSEFRGSDIKQVPVLRIFGPTPEGRKACLHVHGVFPYFYIPCPTPNPEPQYMYQIAASLDKALNIALKQATSANQHVYKITLVKGLPFYGFHDKEHLYLKIFLYSPGLVKQAVELCSNGAILGQALQPHESHLNFTLQFFIDFNLFGMSNIDLQAVKFRNTAPSQSSDEILESPTDTGLKPESSCHYEADCIASHIINRQRVGKGDGIENPGLEEVWNQEIERRKQLNMSMASKSLSQGRLNDETDSHYKHQQMFLIKMSNLIDKPVETERRTDVVDDVYYPAESLEGSQLFDAVDVSVHVPETTVSFSETRRGFDETLVDMDETIVDENVALNCSLHHSQVLLNSEDLELLDMLQDMDEKPIEDDSVMGTPADVEEEADDAEYSQAYNDDTVYLDPRESKDDTNEDSETWNDSFWDGANIPQLDGTFDDEHVKKVRKRKMRPLRLGLSKPKTKKNDTDKCESETHSVTDVSQVDEINVSRETIDDISHLHLRKSVKMEQNTEDQTVDEKIGLNHDTDNVSIMDLVEKVTKNNESIQPGLAEVYDVKNEFIPEAGPSLVNANLSKIIQNTVTDSDTSQELDNSGIVSFYASKLFDVTVDNEFEKTDIEIDNHSEAEVDDFEKVNEINETEQIKYEVKNEAIEPEIINNEMKLDNRETIDVITNDIKYEIKHIKVFTPKIKPPTKSYILNTLDQYNIPKIKTTEPFYSNHQDVGDKVEIGQMILKLQSKLSKDQKQYEKVIDTTSIEEWRQLIFLQTNELSQESSKPEALRNLLAGNRSYILEPLKRPPTTLKIKEWLANKNKEINSEVKTDSDISKNIEELDISQALGLNEDVIDSSLSVDNEEKSCLDNSMQVTMQPDGSFLCHGSGNNKEISAVDTPFVDTNFLTVMLVEVQTAIRGDFYPDPTLDAIRAIFIQITNDCPPNHFLSKNITEILVVDGNEPPKYLERCVFDLKVTYVDTELKLIEKLIEVIKLHDPDIMCGYEIETCSWGYVLERANVLGFEIVREISRITEKYRQKRYREDNDFESRIIGRVLFNVWRLFRHELALSSYSFENCMYEVLKERVPKYSFAQLGEWWGDKSRVRRWMPVEYHMTRLSGTVRMLEKLDIINRTSELARLFGLQWWEVLSRGSQFRVESLMLRAARPLNLVALSPTVKQRAAMKAPECLPLIFEPESRFYTDPMIVLDFQSLYPSMMIAYNYCFSTCIGRVQNINGDAAYEFGAWRLRIPKAKLEALVRGGLVHWSPVGVGFVKPCVRRGVLPALLRRILAARQAVKKNMKLQTDDSVKKAMHSRQLGLKLIANVTYGYTAANFSGRMPCVEVGDSVVAKGRETLERAIRLVRTSDRWNVKVVYGDTDSMFVLVPGRSRREAFEIGQEIADAVTADNPSPVALKLEKVYQPCILQTKKRYVGFMYESADQEKPVYEAKGIETVRRDGCPAGVKVLQRALCELFESGDMSRVKRAVCATLSRLSARDLPPPELMFSREYHGAAGYRPGATAPPNEIAKRVMGADPRRAPRAGWRVQYAVAAGAPHTPLARLARSPAELARGAAPPHVAYYATRVLLPPLHRCLSLLGADVFKWWAEIGYKRESQVRIERGGIARYMSRERCAACGARGAALCANCGGSAAVLAKENKAENHLRQCYEICSSCCGHTQTSKCENTECPIFWRKLTAHQKYTQNREIATHMPLRGARPIIDF